MLECMRLAAGRTARRADCCGGARWRGGERPDPGACLAPGAQSGYLGEDRRGRTAAVAVEADAARSDVPRTPDTRMPEPGIARQRPGVAVEASRSMPSPGEQSRNWREWRGCRSPGHSLSCWRTPVSLLAKAILLSASHRQFDPRTSRRRARRDDAGGFPWSRGACPARRSQRCGGDAADRHWVRIWLEALAGA